MTTETIKALKSYATLTKDLVFLPGNANSNIYQQIKAFDELQNAPENKDQLYITKADGKHQLLLLVKEGEQAFAIIVEAEEIVLSWHDEKGDITHWLFTAPRKIVKSVFMIDVWHYSDKIIRQLKIPITVTATPPSFRQPHPRYTGRDMELFESLYCMAVWLKPFTTSPTEE